MRFKVSQKIFSFGDNFTVQDVDGMDHYQIQGKVFSFGDKLTLMDMHGRELYYIEQQLLKLFAEYNLYRDGKLMATCKKRFSLMGSKFDIFSDMGDFQIEGRPLNYNYAIYRNGIVVATVDKAYFSFSDTYGVDIADTEDYAFILSLVIIIDQVVHDNEGNQH